MSPIATLLRSQALRQLRIPIARQHIRPALRRNYATEQVEHTRSTDPNPPTKSNLPLIAIGCLAFSIPFYYFYHSKKPPNQGRKDMAEARAKGDGPASEYRDVRDSPVKTLEDKRRKEAGENVERGGKV